MQSLSSLFWKSVHSGDVVVEGQTKMKSHLNKKFNNSNLRSLPEASWLISLGEFIQYASLHFIQRRRNLYGLHFKKKPLWQKHYNLTLLHTLYTNIDYYKIKWRLNGSGDSWVGPQGHFLKEEQKK